MTKAIATIGVVIFVILVGVPLLALLRGGEKEASTGSPTHGSLPSPEEAPPEWDTEALAGTIWEADMRTAPDSEHQSDAVFQWRFLENERVTLDIVDVTEPEAEEGEEALELRQFFHDALLPRFEGGYNVEGSQVHVEVTMMQRPVSDIIEIRGRNLYYHGAQLREIEKERADSGAAQAGSARRPYSR